MTGASLLEGKTFSCPWNPSRGVSAARSWLCCPVMFPYMIWRRQRVGYPRLQVDYVQGCWVDFVWYPCMEGLLGMTKHGREATRREGRGWSNGHWPIMMASAYESLSTSVFWQRWWRRYCDDGDDDDDCVFVKIWEFRNWKYSQQDAEDLKKTCMYKELLLIAMGMGKGFL